MTVLNTKRPGQPSRKSRGASLLSYGLIVGLISVVTLAAVTSTGNSVVELFGDVADSTGGVVSSTGAGSGGGGEGGSATPTPTAGPALFDFTSHTFTTCGATGVQGPTVSACRSSYSTTWDENASFYGHSSQGIQEFTIPQTATYRITVSGAQGGRNTNHSCNGGLGATMQGEFNLTEGDVLRILVGQEGEDCANCAGGGGGSFVVDASGNTPLIIAGGGGGGSEDDCQAVHLDASAGLLGKTTPVHGGGSPTCSGQAGQAGYGGCYDPTSYNVLSSGAGLLSGGTGGNGSTPTLAQAFTAGGEGCDTNGFSDGGDGGFGGGGCGQQDGGGGAGGYSGGQSGSGGGSPDGPGGGGGSYNDGANPSNSAGANSGVGSVLIEKL